MFFLLAVELASLDSGGRRSNPPIHFLVIAKLIACVTNETLQLPWCGAVGDELFDGRFADCWQHTELIKEVVADVD
jgi:hypothetical protein